MLLSGCTTASDHTYLWPNGCRIDDEIEVARELGIRFHASRGSMSLGFARASGFRRTRSSSKTHAAILADTERAIDTFHDPEPFAMTRIVVAPCSPFSVTPELMRESIALARDRGVHACSTYLRRDAGRRDVSAFSDGSERARSRIANRLGWTGAPTCGTRTWSTRHADDVAVLGASWTAGVAHCPTSNMRLGSGIAPLRAMLDAGVRVGLGVDGSASNDGSHLLDEVRHASAAAARATTARPALGARETLRIATRGGAAVLGRDDIGALTVGRAADVVGFNLHELAFAGGGVHDPLAALVFCRPANASFTVVAGRVLVGSTANSRRSTSSASVATSTRVAALARWSAPRSRSGQLADAVAGACRAASAAGDAFGRHRQIADPRAGGIASNRGGRPRCRRTYERHL